jgi:Immunity protein 8
MGARFALQKPGPTRHALRVPESGKLRVVVDSIQPLWEGGVPPADSAHFGVLVWVLLRPCDREGADRFDLWVCSPSWFAETYGHSPLPRHLEWLTGRGDFLRYFFATPTWDEGILRQSIEEICEECAGPTWPITALRLNRYMLWEYDYKFDRLQDEHPDKPLPT